jgi:hypothetical protein
MRALYTAGTACILAFLATIAWQSMVARPPTIVSVGTHAGPGSPQPATSGRAWFQATKPYCNSLEVETRLQSAPPPAVADGPGWMAACYSLAGKTDAARALINELPADQRGQAAGEDDRGQPQKGGVSGDAPAQAGEGLERGGGDAQASEQKQLADQAARAFAGGGEVSETACFCGGL